MAWRGVFVLAQDDLADIPAEGVMGDTPQS
jgi:hypothetical protein